MGCLLAVIVAVCAVCFGPIVTAAWVIVIAAVIGLATLISD